MITAKFENFYLEFFICLYVLLKYQLLINLYATVSESNIFALTIGCDVLKRGGYIIEACEGHNH